MFHSDLDCYISQEYTKERYYVIKTNSNVIRIRFHQRVSRPSKSI